MEFSAKDDLDVPIEDAFDLLSEYDVFERMAMRRGIEVQRHDRGESVKVGSAWTVDFEWRGKDIRMDAKVTRFDRPEYIELESIMPGLDVDVKFELVALSRKRTRLHLHLDVRAKTLPMRLLVQSLKLARGNIDKKLQERVKTQCRNLEMRHAQKLATGTAG
ncbi:SRPBCC family protein [Cognatishimia sp. SS12]|uniref:SRPBCC family protein n=1 Tax=Cognatishimia sp. SS12 TaxID=2979465 RepID=UPI00232D97CF|nr:SRPBCC family protein [Cognatishimia sp. SS12]MDC0739152.1 SRPBCC family protein [Cognatishimia sp. SS12]